MNLGPHDLDVLTPYQMSDAFDIGKKLLGA
jgi:hypothetical protein